MIDPESFLEETMNLNLKEIGILTELIMNEFIELSFDQNIETYDISKRSKNRIKAVFLKQKRFIVVFN